jgi:hypothetical protein
MICADLQRLVSSHDQPCLAILLVLEQSHIACATLLPLIRLSDKLEKLCAHLKGLLFEFFVGLDLNLLGEANNRLKVDIF